MKILITGDFFISDPFRGKDLLAPSVKALFAAADHRIVNLEAPVTAGEKRDRILKTGPHLGAAKETTIPFLRKLGVDLVTLANNHIMDYGGPGLDETLMNLSGAGIGTVGAGRDGAEAAAPFVLEGDGQRVAVLNFSENEWASAGGDRAGANPYDVVENLKQIREARRSCERVIVIVHGGQEDYHFPSPRMVREYRFYAENGASAVIGHHPHCISGFEIHQGSPIFYSLGNFLFTLPSEFDWWYTGLVLSLHLGRGTGISWELAPVAFSKTDFSLTRLEGEAEACARREVERYSAIIADDKLLDQEWESFLTRYGRYYLNVFSPLSFIRNDRIKTGLTKLGLDRLFMARAHYAMILNTIRCESHAEAARAVIDRFLK
jgi:poly-gamma-glutamate synthesis protein (capsule biosynthesis protein)